MSKRTAWLFAKSQLVTFVGGIDADHCIRIDPERNRILPGCAVMGGDALFVGDLGELDLDRGAECLDAVLLGCYLPVLSAHALVADALTM